jgi:hypothetical protein
MEEVQKRREPIVNNGSVSFVFSGYHTHGSMLRLQIAERSIANAANARMQRLRSAMVMAI